jgi:23S rRNA U2552 (ribose-2'-O)-methylase RlmE/FtsJ
MNDLEAYFNENKKRVIDKWDHYFDIYERHFSKYQNKDIVVVEIGIYHGGSLQMWKHYFGDKAKIYGIDINPNCKQAEEKNIKVLIGSQSDRDFLKKAINEIPPIDILIDDGGHTMQQQIVSFKELFGHIKPDGVYLCEDLHTSYWEIYGGGFKRKGSFIEYSKNLIDELNAFHSREDSFKISSFTTSVNCMYYYDSVLVIEKKPRTKPLSLKTGIIEIPGMPEVKLAGFALFKVKWEHKLKKKTNKLLAFFRLPSKNGTF